MDAKSSSVKHRNVSSGACWREQSRLLEVRNKKQTQRQGVKLLMGRQAKTSALCEIWHFFTNKAGDVSERLI